MPVIEVKCPCCDHILEIQTDTAQVLSHHKPRPKMDLQSFMQQESGRTQQIEDKFNARKVADQDRMAALEAKFKKNIAKGDELPEPPKIQWD